MDENVTSTNIQHSNNEAVIANMPFANANTKVDNDGKEEFPSSVHNDDDDDDSGREEEANSEQKMLMTSQKTLFY